MRKPLGPPATSLTIAAIAALATVFTLGAAFLILLARI